MIYRMRSIRHAIAGFTPTLTVASLRCARRTYGEENNSRDTTKTAREDIHTQPCHGRCRGFTIIELLVVIAIIGIVAAVVLAALDRSGAEGRDANRASQVQEFVKAVEYHRTDTGRYPDDGVSGYGRQPVLISAIEDQLTATDVMSRIPPDPRYEAENGYKYCSSDDGRSFAILVNVEDDSGTDYCAVSNGVDAYTNGLCSGLASLDRCPGKF